MKCPNCGANIDNNAQFCPNCGNNVKFKKQSEIISKNNSTLQDIINVILSKPKLVIALVVIIILFFGITSIFNSDNGDVNSNGGSDIITVYGLNFNVPNGYEVSDHSELTSGEVVELKDGAYIIEISVSDNRNFKESKYIDSKMDMTINNKQGTLYQYKAPSNGVAFVYYDEGNLVVIRGAGPSELKEIIV